MTTKPNSTVDFEANWKKFMNQIEDFQPKKFTEFQNTKEEMDGRKSKYLLKLKMKQIMFNKEYLTISTPKKLHQRRND
jgi:hypothetical protein